MTWLRRRNWRKFIYGTRWWRSAILTCCENSLKCSTRWWSGFTLMNLTWIFWWGMLIILLWHRSLIWVIGGCMFLRMMILCRTMWRQSRRRSPAIFYQSTCDGDFPPFVCRILERISSATSISSSIWSTEHIFVISSSNPASKISFSSNICSTTFKRLHMISYKSVCSRAVLASFMLFVTTVRCPPRFARRRSNFSFSSPMITNETTQCYDDKWKRLKRVQTSAPCWAPCYEQKNGWSFVL